MPGPWFRARADEGQDIVLDLVVGQAVGTGLLKQQGQEILWLTPGRPRIAASRWSMVCARSNGRPSSTFCPPMRVTAAPRTARAADPSDRRGPCGAAARSTSSAKLFGLGGDLAGKQRLGEDLDRSARSCRWRCRNTSPSRRRSSYFRHSPRSCAASDRQSRGHGGA
jgi:hypothetical protein